MSEKTGICIVWPAYFEGSTDPEAHVTALFLGNTDNVNYTKDQVEHAIWAMSRYGNFGIHATVGTALFGKNKDKPVILLEDGALRWAVDKMTALVAEIDITPSTLFPFNPHITVPEGSVIPENVHLGRPVVWWGNERELHPQHAKREKAVNAAIAAVKDEHGEWYGHLAKSYRPVVVSAVNGALKAVA